MKLLPTTKNILSLLKESKVIRLKRNTSRSSKYLDGVFEEFKELAKQDKNLRYFESEDPKEMIIMYDLNYKIETYIV